MAKVLVGAVAFLAVALIYPASSQAGSRPQATIEGMSLEPNPELSVTGDPPVDCSSITDCQAVPDDPSEGDHNPAIVFDMAEDGTVHVEAGIWFDVNDCPGAPDATAVGDLFRPAGLSRIRIVFTPPLEDGAVFSIQWALAMCPVTDCTNYVLGTPPPDFCPI
jgi:hypothetical protein